MPSKSMRLLSARSDSYLVIGGGLQERETIAQLFTCDAGPAQDLEIDPADVRSSFRVGFGENASGGLAADDLSLRQIRLSDERCIWLQDLAEAERMQGPGDQTAPGPDAELDNPRADFAGRGSRVRDAGEAAGRRDLLQQQGSFDRQGLSFSGAGTCDNHRALQAVDGLALPVVEARAGRRKACQIFKRSRSHRMASMRSLGC